jgi:hypothetical protein
VHQMFLITSSLSLINNLTPLSSDVPGRGQEGAGRMSWGRRGHGAGRMLWSR